MTRAERLTNPIPYSSKYFGHKVHIDQNEKLVLFGVTHVCAVDGYSGMIVGFATFLVKNNAIIIWAFIQVSNLYSLDIYHKQISQAYYMTIYSHALLLLQ